MNTLEKIGISAALITIGATIFTYSVSLKFDVDYLTDQQISNNNNLEALIKKNIELEIDIINITNTTNTNKDTIKLLENTIVFQKDIIEKLINNKINEVNKK